MPVAAKPIVVIAGQTPPPTGGQNVMIARLLDDLRGDARWRTEHLDFRFTPSFTTARQANLAKVWELLKVYGRLIRLSLRHGRVDLLIYPSGGPQTVPVVRDILLLPFIRHVTTRLWVQFHAAGIGDRLRRRNRGRTRWRPNRSGRRQSNCGVFAGWRNGPKSGGCL